VGCATAGTPVPSQAEHLTSVDASSDFKFFMAIISWIQRRRIPYRYARRIADSDCPLQRYPAQFFSVTVPKSFLSSRQQTRAPTFNNLDREPVIRFTVSPRFY
jgi:hypothetical protein